MFFSRSFTCPLWPPFSGVYESTSMFQDHPLHSWFQITVKLLIIIPAFFGSPILHSVFFKETLQILTVPTCTTRGPSAATKLPWCLQRAQTCLADLVLSHHTLGSVRPIIEAWISPSKDYRSVELLKSVDEGFDHQWGRTDEDPKPLSWPEIHRCWGKELEPSWTMLPIHTWTKWRFHKPANALGLLFSGIDSTQKKHNNLHCFPCLFLLFAELLCFGGPVRMWWFWRSATKTSHPMWYPPANQHIPPMEEENMGKTSSQLPSQNPLGPPYKDVSWLQIPSLDVQRPALCPPVFASSFQAKHRKWGISFGDLAENRNWHFCIVFFLSVGSRVSDDIKRHKHGEIVHGQPIHGTKLFLPLVDLRASAQKTSRCLVFQDLADIDCI